MAKAKVPVTINGLEFDALISEERTLEATVPEYTIETGFSVSDTIILGAEKLSMTLYVTNTPVTWQKRHGTSQSRVSNVCSRLEQMYFNRTLVTIVTSDKTYRNMAIESISFSKSLETGYAREIPISFKKVQKTSATTTTIPDSYGKSGTTGASGGTAGTSSGSSGSSTGGSGNSKDKGSILWNIGRSIGLFD